MGSETLSRLRYAAGRLRDCPSAAVRDIGSQMVAEIDAEISRPAAPTHHADLSTASLDALLSEIARRVRANRHVRRVCDLCHRAPVRAKGLCMPCYQKSRKNERSA